MVKFIVSELFVKVDDIIDLDILMFIISETTFCKTDLIIISIKKSVELLKK